MKPWQPSPARRPGRCFHYRKAVAPLKLLKTLDPAIGAVAFPVAPLKHQPPLGLRPDAPRFHYRKAVAPLKCVAVCNLIHARAKRSRDVSIEYESTCRHWSTGQCTPFGRCGRLGNPSGCDGRRPVQRWVPPKGIEPVTLSQSGPGQTNAGDLSEGISSCTGFDPRTGWHRKGLRPGPRRC